MKIVKIGIALMAVVVLTGSVTFAQERNRDTSNETYLQVLMTENDTMMQMMHGMMDQFKEMAPEGPGMRDMEGMMQKMSQMRTNHRMDMMLQENGQMMALMHKVMGHLKQMDGGAEGKREMSKLMDRMETTQTHHQAMMAR